MGPQPGLLNANLHLTRFPRRFACTSKLRNSPLEGVIIIPLREIFTRVKMLNPKVNGKHI